MESGRVKTHHRAPACRPPPSNNCVITVVITVPAQMRKPLIERKRRERINTCLDQLKEAVIGAFQLDVSIRARPRVSRPPGNPLNTGTRLSTAVQAGEGRYPGDDRQASAEHPEQQAQW